MKQLGVVCCLLTVTNVKAEEVSIKQLDYIVCGAVTDDATPTLKKQVAEWQRQHVDYDVQLQFVPWNQCQEKAITLAAAGNPAAIASVSTRILPQLSEGGLIRPMDLHEDQAKRYPSNVLSSIFYEDKLWGIPTAFTTKALYWNKSLFQQAGLDMPEGPKTFDDVIHAAKTISENTEARGFGMAAASFDSTVHQFLNWLYSNGGRVLNEEGDVVFDSPQTVQTLTFFKDLVPYTQEGVLAYDRAKLEPLFAGDQVAMYVNGGWGALHAGDVDFGISPIPVGPSGDVHSTVILVDAAVVFEGSGVESAAEDLLRFISSPERQRERDLASNFTPIEYKELTEHLLENDPSWAPFLGTIEDGFVEPWFYDYGGMQDAIIDAIQSVVLGDATPEDATRQAGDELRLLNNR